MTTIQQRLAICLSALLLCGQPARAIGQGQAPGRPERLLDGAMHHLGDDETPEWPEAPVAPEGSGLAFDFVGSAFHGPWTLAYNQRHISNHWRIEINGQLVATLPVRDDLFENYVEIPAGVLKEGTNRFELITDSPADDITFGRIRLIPKSFREALNLVPVSLVVRELNSMDHIPARFTVLDATGNPAPLYFADLPTQAARQGVVYTQDGSASFEVSAGDYRVIASRGSEWSIDAFDLSFKPFEPGDLGGLQPPNAIFTLVREVNTTGYVAADTHIHTLTFSGHGDSTVEERLVTLVGEGVELAISTDHNHNTDYRPYQVEMGLLERFKSVVGNEVTTPIGHFNAFPLKAADEIPPHDLTDMVKLVEGMRAKGAQVVILNHPRWPDHERGPFGVFELNHFTGHSHATEHGQYPFDAMELVNSTTEENDPMLLFQDWFALLNRGEKVFAVGSSDSHTVGDPVGGGRTYVKSQTDEPGKINVLDACKNLAAGHSSISMGIFVESRVTVPRLQKTAGMGEFLVGVRPEDSCRATLRVCAPSWVQPRKAELYANGELIKRVLLDQEFDRAPNAWMDREIEVQLEDRHRGQDAWLVWVVTGDGVQGGFWPLHNDYTLGATNPIFVDWSGDGTYQSPRDTAHWLAESLGAERAVTAESWKSVNWHAMELLREKLLREAREKLERIGESALLGATELEAFLAGSHEH